MRAWSLIFGARVAVDQLGFSFSRRGVIASRGFPRLLLCFCSASALLLALDSNAYSGVHSTAARHARRTEVGQGQAIEPADPR